MEPSPYALFESVCNTCGYKQIKEGRADYKMHTIHTALTLLTIVVTVKAVNVEKQIILFFDDHNYSFVKAGFKLQIN